MKQSSKLNCLLIAPPISYEDEKNIWKAVNSNFPPLGLASIAAYIRFKRKSVKIIDCSIECPSVDSFIRFFNINIAEEYEDIDVIGITGYIFGRLLKIRSKDDILILLDGLNAVTSFLKPKKYYSRSTSI